MEDDKYQKLRNYALKLLSFRPRSYKELSGRLMQYSIKKGIPKTIVEKIISELTNQNLINDEEFAVWWIEQRRSSRKPKGQKVIELELLQKGIDKEIIDKLLLGDNDVMESEFQNALSLASKKQSLYKNYPPREARAKIGGYLFRRGFTWVIINRVIDSIFTKE
jgi:regulatory protein